MSKAEPPSSPHARYTTPEHLGVLPLFLCTDAAEMVTGEALPIGAAWLAQ